MRSNWSAEAIPIYDHIVAWRHCVSRSTKLGRYAFLRPSTSAPGASTWLRWSFGQPGLPQSFFVSQKVFGLPKRAQHVFESGNT